MNKAVLCDPLPKSELVMDDKIRKYIWIAFCASIAICHIVLMIMLGFFSLGMVTVLNVAYVMVFVTAIIRELNLNKAVFYIMLIASLLTFVYGIFFTKSWA
jgi:hypothetical protein